MKKVSVRHVAKRIILTNCLFFLSLHVWQITWFCFLNSDNAEPSNPLVLLFFSVSVIIWIFSYYEIRMITKEGKRFLGYKAYVLFFYKLLCFPLFLGTTLYMKLLTNAIFLTILALTVWSILFFVYFYFTIRPYKNNIKANDILVTICYTKTLVQWNLEEKHNGRK